MDYFANLTRFFKILEIQRVEDSLSFNQKAKDKKSLIKRNKIEIEPNLSSENNNSSVSVSDTFKSNKNVNQVPKCLPFERLSEGKQEFGVSENAEELPAWFDPKLAARGQKFAKDHLYGVFYSHLISLIILMGEAYNNRLLSYTGKSDSAERSLKRYLATLLQVKVWYDVQIYEKENKFYCESSPFFKSLKKVRSIHKKIGNNLAEKKPNFFSPLQLQEFNNNNKYNNKRSTKDDETQALKSERVKNRERYIWEAFRADLQMNKNKNRGGGSLSPNLTQIERKSLATNEYIYFSQYDMAITQWSFMGLTIACPEMFGIRKYSEEDIEGFAHLWAIIGHLLGMKEEYNICLNENLILNKIYAERILREHFVPWLFHLDYEGEIMWGYFIKAMKEIIPYLSMEGILVLILEDIAEIPCPILKKRMSWLSWAYRFIAKNILEPLLDFAWFRSFANYMVNRWVQKAAMSHFSLQNLCPITISEQIFY